MDQAQAIDIARRYVGFLQDGYDIQRAILFGSYAKGTHHEDSDIDIAIVLKKVNDIIDTQIAFMGLPPMVKNYVVVL